MVNRGLIVHQRKIHCQSKSSFPDAEQSIKKLVKIVSKKERIAKLLYNGELSITKQINAEINAEKLCNISLLIWQLMLGNLTNKEWN